MSLRTALGQSKILTFAVLLAAFWTLSVAVEVLGAMEGLFAATNQGIVGAYVGQLAATGVMGALVMAGLLGLLVYLFGELGQTEPTPDPWPPESK